VGGQPKTLIVTSIVYGENEPLSQEMNLKIAAFEHSLEVVKSYSWL
jgi:hypothetical protein